MPGEPGRRRRLGVAAGDGLDVRARERLRSEALAAVGLQHPGIVELHDFRWEGDTAFVETAEVEGETLAQYLARVGRLPALQGLALALQLLSALAFAHGRGLVHSAIHPQHLLVSRNGQLKIDGFGWLAAAASLGRRPGPFDAPAYMAPEQILGRRADHRADLYSAAVVAYELLAGAWPFQAHAAPRPPRELRPELPAALDAVFERAQARSPEARFQSATEFAAALQAAFGTPVWERAVAPAPRGPIEQAEETEAATDAGGGRRAINALLAGIAATVVLGATFVAVESARGPQPQPVAPAALVAPAASPPVLRPVESVPAAAPVEPPKDVRPEPEPEPQPQAEPPRPSSRPPKATPQRATPHPRPRPDLQAHAAPARKAPPSPLRECRQDASMARELCVAFECATAEYRRHPVCVRMHAEAVVRHRLDEARYGP